MVSPAEAFSVKERKPGPVIQVSEKHGLVFLAMLVLNLKPGKNG
jgi:hypothetical protein